MESKTCGECRHFKCSGEGQCVDGDWIYSDTHACNWFATKVITNGDVIRQEGNRSFAEYFVFETGAMFESTLIVDKTFDTYEEAVEATETYLNAPADCVGKDIDVPTKESGVEDE